MKDFRDMHDEYDEKSFFDKITKFALQIGGGLVYKALQLYYVTQKPNCPTKVKLGIYGALAYLVSPLDIIPDFLPAVGYTDDAAVVLAAIGIASFYIDEEVREKAYQRLAGIIGEDAADKIV